MHLDWVFAEGLTGFLIDAKRSARFNHHLGSSWDQGILCAQKCALPSGNEHGVWTLLHHNLPILGQVGLVWRLAHLNQCGNRLLLGYCFSKAMIGSRAFFHPAQTNLRVQRAILSSFVGIYRALDLFGIVWLGSLLVALLVRRIVELQHDVDLRWLVLELIRLRSGLVVSLVCVLDWRDIGSLQIVSLRLCSFIVWDLVWSAKLELLAVAVTCVGSVKLVWVVSCALRRDKNLAASMRLLVIQMIRASCQLRSSLN